MKKLSLMFSLEASLLVKTSKTIFSSRVDINLILNGTSFIKLNYLATGALQGYGLSPAPF